MCLFFLSSLTCEYFPNLTTSSFSALLAPVTQQQWRLLKNAEISYSVTSSSLLILNIITASFGYYLVRMLSCHWWNMPGNKDTQWCPCDSCLLSPLLFALFLNDLDKKNLKKSFFLLPDDFFCYFVSFAIYGWLLLSRPFQRRLIAEDCPSLITATLYLRKSMSSTNWYIIGHPYTTLHYTTLNYITLNYTTLQYIALHLTLLPYITLHCTTFN